MGTPSGSKNCNIFNDRQQILAAKAFDGELDCVEEMAEVYKEGGDAKQLKKQKLDELQEFRNAKSGDKIAQKLGRLDRITGANKRSAGPVGPSEAPAAKRRLPSFVKVKSSDSLSASPQEDTSEQAGPSPEAAATADSAREGAVTASAESKAIGGLLGYGSGSDDEDASGSDAEGA
eukprot:gnl/TRDRNA2_/TRDRNA2_47516_c0_seq2.p1 gnl/TRDRNA2_/TRDRNA2_47516_c0~~gnl/TRDRNA2_/TRDRNA2_47516_c0_seq2.p1  ORF type:complete len:176 (+),score=46.20 gnl/TRDRNA2_/TRDRNA2_47516_c0_seq2:50-577(+)